MENGNASCRRGRMFESAQSVAGRHERPARTARVARLPKRAAEAAGARKPLSVAIPTAVRDHAAALGFRADVAQPAKGEALLHGGRATPAAGSDPWSQQH